MPLTTEEKVRIRHHLGFLNVAEAYTFVLGVPAGVETQFIIEGAMNRVLEAALPLLRQKLAQCDDLDARLTNEDVTDLALVAKLGEIESSGNAFEQLKGMLDHRRREIARILGVMPNPFDQVGWGGVNVPVRH